MKGVLVIIDGMGDLPLKIIDDKTALEAAKMPNLDFLAARGEMGYMYPVKPGFVPGSDEAIVSIFGNNLENSSRGQLEAIGSGLDLEEGDLALRVNFATIDSLKNGNVIDRRVGRTLTTKEANLLAKSLNQIKMSCKFEFKATIQHRGALVFREGVFSGNITGNDPTYSAGTTKEMEKINISKPKDDSENSRYSANIVNEFVEKAYEVLNNHPVNKNRRNRGLMPANYLLVRGAGTERPKLKKYPKWISPSYMPLEIGFSKVCDMTVKTFTYPKLKTLDAYDNLYDGLKKACKFNIKILKKYHKKFDYAYVHIKETDLPGHDNKVMEKIFMLEYIDQTFFKFLRGFVPKNEIKVVVTADHSTPCKLKNHSSDPVPVLLYNNSSIPRAKKFCEKEAKKGTLGRIMGQDLLKVVGFNK